jgi:uncharacterized protein with PQ loop repeat
MSLADALAVVATLLAAVFLLPQIGQLVTTRDVRGVSITWVLFGIMTNVAWVVYLTGQRLWVPLVAPALAAGTYAAVLALLIRFGPIYRTGSSACLLYGSVLGLAGGLGGWQALAVVLALSPAIQIAPGVREVYRHARPSGVSASTWSIAGAEAAVWGAYGALVSDPALLGYGIVTGAGSVLVLSRLWVTRRCSAKNAHQACDRALCGRVVPDPGSGTHPTDPAAQGRSYSSVSGSASVAAYSSARLRYGDQREPKLLHPPAGLAQTRTHYRRPTCGCWRSPELPFRSLPVSAG